LRRRDGCARHRPGLDRQKWLQSNDGGLLLAASERTKQKDVDPT